MIRKATAGDSEQIWEMLMDLHSRQAYFKLSLQKLVVSMMAAIDGGTVLVAEKDGELVGTFAWMVVDGTYYSDDKFLADLWMYVKPGKCPTAALLMKREMKRAAKAAGLPLMPGVVGPEQRGVRLFDKDPDFEKAGVLYIMRK